MSLAVPFPERSRGTRRRSVNPALKLVAAAMAGAVAFRTFGYEGFNIPSGSMMPTLLAGDTVIVSKLSYGPFALSPWFGGGPRRGDVAVFKLPRNPSADYIKRIVGLPGDKVQMVGGTLHLNGTAVQQERVGDFLDRTGSGARIPQYVERLAGACQHPVLNTLDRSALDDTPAWVVPPGYVFVLGDNRDASEDSRSMAAVGFIPLDNLVGRAEFRLFSLGAQVRWWELWRWPSALRLDRVLTRIC